MYVDDIIVTSSSDEAVTGLMKDLNLELTKKGVPSLYIIMQSPPQYIRAHNKKKRKENETKEKWQRYTMLHNS